MATEQEVLDDLIQAITNTNTSNDDFLKVLKEGRDQDVALRDGTVVPSLTKRVVNAFSNSDYLMKADNLASVVDKQEARDNLNVPTKEDVIEATSQATETTAGTAKIATTAIAQAGVNDTDFITAKKLAEVLDFDYVNKTATRSVNTVYTNDSKIRILNLTSSATSATITSLRVAVTKNSITTLLVVDMNAGTGTLEIGGTVVIPPNAQYKVNFYSKDGSSILSGLSIKTWLEG